MFVSSALNTLTFQALPRDMRRRAASHKLTRLPAHLRAKAAREVLNFNCCIRFSFNFDYIHSRVHVNNRFLFLYLYIISDGK